MTSAHQTVGPDRETQARAVTPGLVMLAVLSIGLVACYLPMLLMTGRTIIFSDDMAYGFFAPIVALYIVWDRRNALLAPTGTPSAWALFFIVLGAGLGVVATLANSSTFSRFGFLLSLAGCLLLIGGWKTLRRLIFPLSLLFFTFPVPAVLYGQITQPLQILATRISESFFETLGYSALREGNIIQLSHMKLSVVEACSGLRSLVTLFFFCLVYGFFFETRNWVRLLIALAAIPSAIFVNAVRITSTGVMGKYNMAWTEGTYHEMVGWTAFAIGFLLVLLAHRLVLRFLPPHPPAGVAA